MCRGRTCHGQSVDKRLLRYSVKMRKRVALKYCGGCDSGFDRVAHFERIRAAAGDSIEWVVVDDGRLDAVLIVSGCATGCPERSLEGSLDVPMTSTTSDDDDPEKIVDTLLK